MSPTELILPPAIPVSIPAYDPDFTEYPWQFENTGGGSWSSPNWWTIRYNIADSVNCGGSYDYAQQGLAEMAVLVPVNGAVTVHATGMIEGQNPGYDEVSVYYNTSEIIYWTSDQAGNGCTMVYEEIDAGETFFFVTQVTIFVDVDTIDKNYHKDAYWQLSFGFDWL